LGESPQDYEQNSLMIATDDIEIDLNSDFLVPKQ
jgi:hypothetical protein